VIRRLGSQILDVLNKNEENLLQNRLSYIIIKIDIVNIVL
jgi:hypothetical protein